jgi:hypothetical protein
MSLLEVPTNILVLSEVDETEEEIHTIIKEAFSIFGIGNVCGTDST